MFEEDTTDYDSTDDDVFDQIDAEFASAAANPAPPADNSSSYGVGTYNTETGSGGFNAGGFVSKRSKKNKKK